VNLVVDGQATRIQTTAGQVGDVLKSRGYHVGPHDLVAPAVDASVHSGSTVIYKRGRLLHLNVNGVAQNIWTTAPTVADALSQLGYSTADFTSVSRSRRLPLSPTDIAVRTPNTVTIVRGKQSLMVTTLDTTVGQLLADQGGVSGDDRISVALTAPITNGQRIVVQQVTRKTVTATKAVPYKTTIKPDATMTKGQSKLLTAGKAGLAKVTYAEVFVDGKLVGKTPIKSVVVTAPTTKVQQVGTKKAPVVHIKVSPGSAKAIAQQLLTARGWGDDQFSCLVTLWNHESGWRVNAANPSGAYGIPQALPGSKMAKFGSDWQSSAKTQIEWGLSYISGRYNTPCGAWSSWQANGGWY
jgi:uncharacterized protein YabE (DUF348 family)